MVPVSTTGEDQLGEKKELAPRDEPCYELVLEKQVSRQHHRLPTVSMAVETHWPWVSVINQSKAHSEVGLDHAKDRLHPMQASAKINWFIGGHWAAEFPSVRVRYSDTRLCQCKSATGRFEGGFQRFPGQFENDRLNNPCKRRRDVACQGDCPALYERAVFSFVKSPVR